MSFTSGAFARAALILLTISTAVPAAAQPERWTLRAGILGTDYQKRLVTGFSQGYTELELDGGFGFGVAAEYRPNPYIGWELSASRLSLDADLRSVAYRVVSFDPFILREETVFRTSGHLLIEPVAVSLLIHPFRDRRVDLYVGPQVAWVFFKEELDEAGDHEPDPGVGGKIGAEMRLGEGSPWSVALEVQHLQIPHDTLEHELYTDIGIQTASIVFGYHAGSRR